MSEYFLRVADAVVHLNTPGYFYILITLPLFVSLLYIYFMPRPKLEHVTLIIMVVGSLTGYLLVTELFVPVPQVLIGHGLVVIPITYSAAYLLKSYRSSELDPLREKLMELMK